MCNTINFLDKAAIRNNINLLLPLVAFLLFFTLNTEAQNTSSPGTVSLAIGASYGMAPTLTYDNRETSGNFYSLYGDGIINEKFVGRVQVSKLDPNSLSDGQDLLIDSGWSINGSLGYNITLSSLPSLHIPVMGTMGYASITRSNGYSRPGMQVGGTLAPKYYLSDKVMLNLSMRILKGVSVDKGSKLGQTDISIGAMIRIL